MLEGLQLKKEWQLMYDVISETLKENSLTETSDRTDKNAMASPKFITVYTSVMEKEEPKKQITSGTTNSSNDSVS